MRLGDKQTAWTQAFCLMSVYRLARKKGAVI